MIRIAIPNKGRLLRTHNLYFQRCRASHQWRSRKSKTLCKNYRSRYPYSFARAADIPEYVQDGAADVGVTGMDLITERGARVEALLDLKFGKASLVLAVPEESNFQKAQDLEGKKIATEFPEITSQYFKKLGVNIDIIKVSGACEMTPHVGIADAIVDISSSGTTLMINHLKAIDTVFSSTVYLIANKESLEAKEKILDIKTALESVLNAKKRRYLMMNVPEASLNAVKEVLPGMSGPTVMKVEPGKFSGGESILAVHAVVDADLIFTISKQAEKSRCKGYSCCPY